MLASYQNPGRDSTTMRGLGRVYSCNKALWCLMIFRILCFVHLRAGWFRSLHMTSIRPPYDLHINSFVWQMGRHLRCSPNSAMLTNSLQKYTWTVWICVYKAVQSYPMRYGSSPLSFRTLLLEMYYLCVTIGEGQWQYRKHFVVPIVVHSFSVEKTRVKYRPATYRTAMWPHTWPCNMSLHIYAW